MMNRKTLVASAVPVALAPVSVKKVSNMEDAESDESVRAREVAVLFYAKQ